ncbi:MAG TPA: peptidase, partial [Mariniphaga anaerophila]|nr:peptidase [Mariniphaga anaerophila]
MLAKMTRKLFFILLIFPLFCSAQNTFSEFFLPKSLRFDFLMGGNSGKVSVYPVQLKQEPHWAGSQINLIDIFHYGSYRFRVFDMETDHLIFSKGFSTLFQEWQTTAEAKQMDKTFYQAVIFPFPQKKIRLEIDARQWEGHFLTIFSTEIDPDDYFILREKPHPYEAEVILENGNPEIKVDLVILSEGYTEVEKDKFFSDAKRVTGYLFEEDPFKLEMSKFNVRAVFVPSVDSGTDVPGEEIYRNTAFNSTFYTFDLPRYLTTSDMKSVYDAAAVVPYDHLYL